MSGSSSLFSRFAASTALLAMAIVVLAFVSFHAIRGDIFYESFESPLDEWSIFVAGRIGDDPEIARQVALNHNMGVVLTTNSGTFAIGPDGSDVTPEYLQESFPNARTIVVEGHFGSQYTFHLPSAGRGSRISPGLWGLIAGLLIIVAVTYVVQLSQLRPLRWLQEGVEKVSEGDLTTRVPVVRMDEVGQVGRAFNRMTERVQQMLDDHDRLMADVSHELRSPLARMKVALEMMPEGNKRDQIAADIREMESLTSALLERERIKHNTAQQNFADFDVAATLRDAARAFDGREPGVRLALAAEPMKFYGDEDLLRVMVQNLLDNALKFSLEDSAEVQLALSQDNDEIQITVVDDGRGISADDANRVMEAFVKLDPSRGHRSGYGLGLNLCQRIVEAHGGEIDLQASEGRGTTVSVTLPKVKQSA